MISAPLIETARLTLRPHRRSDFDALHALWCQEPVYRFTRGKPSTEEESWHRLLRYGGMWPLTGLGFWAIELRETGGYIGETGFADFHRDVDPPFGDKPEAGWILDPRHWNSGLMSEAVAAVMAWADANKPAPISVCMISPENTASLKLAHRFGFHRYADATYHDDAVVLLERKSA